MRVERLSIRAAVAHLQQRWGYSAPFPERNVCNWLQSGALAGELVEPVPGWDMWVTTDAAIDAAWQAGSIPPKRGRPRIEEADLKQAIITTQNTQTAIQSSYNWEFVQALKKAVPYQERSFDRDTKTWLVSEDRAEEAIRVTRQFFDVVDGRGKSNAEIEDVQLDAEIAQIRHHQQFILAHEAEIEERIKELDAHISRYSFSSKSSVKGGLCRDRALLAHSLTNAAMPVEKLTELQVRGLAAAVRYLEG